MGRILMPHPGRTLDAIEGESRDPAPGRCGIQLMRLQRAFELPGARHLPGRNDRPEGGPVAAAAAAARETFGPDSWADSAAYLYGFDLVAGGFFWEAHEVWEPVWMRCLPNSRERAVVQGLIQCANAGLKAVMGMPGASARLLLLAAALFDDAAGPGAAAGPVIGIEAASAAAAVRGLGVTATGRDVGRGISCCQELRPICNIMQ